jgi:predicted transcriptional regulator
LLGVLVVLGSPVIALHVPALGDGPVSAVAASPESEVDAPLPPALDDAPLPRLVRLDIAEPGIGLAPNSDTPASVSASPADTGAVLSGGAVEKTGACALLAAIVAIVAGGVDGLRSLLAVCLVGLRRALRGLVVAPLFSRIEGASILENPVRQRIHEAIGQDPGLCMQAVRQRTGVAWGTAVYHLHRLERGGLVVSVRSGSSRRYFAANTPVSRHRAHIAALGHPTAQRIAHVVHANPGINQAGVCRQLGLLNPAASKHLGRLESLGLIATQRAGRSRLYQATEALDAALGVLQQPAPAPRA